MPTYNPTVVYGAWPYPAYPPTTTTRRGTSRAARCSASRPGSSSAARCGDAIGSWRGDVNVNVNRYNNFNRTNINNSNWNHNAQHTAARCRTGTRAWPSSTGAAGERRPHRAKRSAAAPTRAASRSSGGEVSARDVPSRDASRARVRPPTAAARPAATPRHERQPGHGGARDMGGTRNASAMDTRRCADPRLQQPRRVVDERGKVVRQHGRRQLQWCACRWRWRRCTCRWWWRTSWRGGGGRGGGGGRRSRARCPRRLQRRRR